MRAALSEGNKVVSMWVATKLIGWQLSPREKSRSAVYDSLLVAYSSACSKAGVGIWDCKSVEFCGTLTCSLDPLLECSGTRISQGLTRQNRDFQTLIFW